MEYQEFRKQYEEQHPASVPVLEIEMNEYPGWVRWAVLATFVCAALVSGVHTVPTVWKSIEVGAIITPEIRNAVSLASLVAIELAILLSAYLMAKGVKLAYFVVSVASVVAVSANLYSVITAFNAGGDAGALVVAIFLGIGAPTIALFTGKMFVDIHRADRIQDTRAKRLFRDASIAWDKEVEKAWKAYQKSGKVSERPSVDVRADTGQPSASGYGYNRKADAKDIVRKHLSDNPDDLNVSVRDLANRLNVGKTTVSDVQREMKERTSSNGNGNGHN